MSRSGSIRGRDEDDDDHYGSEGSNSSKRRRSERLEREVAELNAERDKFFQIFGKLDKKRAAKETARHQMNLYDDSGFRDEMSRRRRRKDQTKYPAVYNDFGVHTATSLDVCDCLEAACPGCHDPCISCKSQKCGVRCRCHRDWMPREIIAQSSDGPEKIVRSKQQLTNDKCK